MISKPPTVETQLQLQPALLRLSATFSLLTRQVLLFRSTNGNKGTKTRRSSEVCIEAIAHIFPWSICSRIYSGGWAIGEGYETANYGSLVHFAFCVPSLFLGAFSNRLRHGLFGWAGF